MTTPTAGTEDLLRQLAPQVLAAIVRRYGNFDLAEDATQEAMVAAATQWPRDGLPQNPKGWLVTVAARRLVDLLRADQARRRREDTVARWSISEVGPPSPDDQGGADVDDTLVLFLLCCHPSLSVASQIALTLRAVGGLTTSEIARALLVSEDTVTRRITRAKRSVKESGVSFALPPSSELVDRLGALLRVLYLIFNEGYAATVGTELLRLDLAEEAIRLARSLQRARPEDSEVAGLLALMLLVHARHGARTGADGSLIPMDEQDRGLWDRAAIDEGINVITDALPRGPTGPYQLQAAIAAVHDEAESPDTTDWPQIAALYGVLLQLENNPVIALNHAVAVSKVAGTAAGLELLRRLDFDPRMTGDRRFHAVRAHLLELDGNPEHALDAYQIAVRLATNVQQQRYLNKQISRLQNRT